jgi:prepilin-type N-terminal cleavage/methylation domain-containing protein
VRRAFTLIELLVVIAIIALLVSLTTAGIMKFMDTGPQTATRTELRSIKSKFDTQWKAVRDEAFREPIPDATFAAIKAVLPAAANAPSNVRNEYVSQKLIQAFPQSIKEALNPPAAYQPGRPGQLTAWQPYKNYLNGLGITSGAATPDQAEEGFCLLMILEHGPKNTGVAAGDFGSGAIGEVSVRKTGGSATVTANALVDGWHQPLVFSRKLSTAASATSAGGSPIIVSGGRDLQLGLKLDPGQPDDLSIITTPTDQTRYTKDNLDTTNIP